MRSDITVGNTFPDFELPDHTGTKRKLSFLQGHDPMVIMIGRGVWCPKDRMQLRELVHFSQQCAVGFTRLVTITTDSFILSNDLRLGVGADWPFLHDDRRVMMNDLEIQEYTDPVNNPMIPHTFVLEPGLKIYKIYNGYWFFGRPTVEELRVDLRATLQRCRPDWDISSVEQRAAWANGEKARFFPYGKTQAQMFADQD